VYQNKALKWLIKELAARVGYWEVEFDDSSEWNMTVSYLTLASDQNDWRALDFGRGRARWWWVVPPIPVILEFAGTVDGFTVLQKLLGLVGGAAKWGHGDSTEVLYCFIPQKQGESPTADHTFSDGEILSGLYVDSWAWPTRVRVVGAEVAPTTVRRLYQAQDIENALASGMDVFSLIYSNDLTTQAQCQTVASGALDDADARAWGGWLKVRPNVGLELWDVITFTDSKAGAGMAGVKRRVNGLVTEFDPLKKVWVQTVYLEGV